MVAFFHLNCVSVKCQTKRNTVTSRIFIRLPWSYGTLQKRNRFRSFQRKQSSDTSYVLPYCTTATSCLLVEMLRFDCSTIFDLINPTSYHCIRFDFGNNCSTFFYYMRKVKKVYLYCSVCNDSMKTIHLHVGDIDNVLICNISSITHYVLTPLLPPFCSP